MPFANNSNLSAFEYSHAELTWSNHYLWPVLRRIVEARDWPERRAFEIGCGNGAIANLLSTLGFAVTGIDPSESGIAVARAAYPHLRVAVGDAYDDLAGQYGTFPLVVSLEVIEHCFYPRRLARTFHDLIERGGVGVLSTPYHGYLKNLVLALAGQWDAHLGPLWDGGHIKFFSVRTLQLLLEEVGFQQVDFIRVGRIPPFAKSLVAVVRK
jgi:2-polyprenyl-6-hydroxyphenyl methylase/3-demethylubiquinone-9 3-methyltransferase